MNKFLSLKRNAWLWSECHQDSDIESVCSRIKNIKFGKIISIDGNIGSGKSTAIKSISSVNRDHGKNYINVQSEPIDKWFPWLGLFYEDMKKRVIGFQFKILKSYYDLILNMSSSDNLVIERTPYTAWNIFVRDSTLLDQYELDLLREYFD
jgi:deoxyadenosine/deoxycytidine kinase